MSSLLEGVRLQRKLNDLLSGEKLELNGKQIVLRLTENGYQLAIIARNETKNQDELLPFDIDFSQFIRILAKGD